MLVDLPIRHHLRAADIIADLAEAGIALIDGIIDASALTALAQSAGKVIPHPDSGPDGVTFIEDRGEHSVALAGFTRSTLAPHTDRSSVAAPPILLLTACGRAPRAGGEIQLVDGRAVYDDLANTVPATLEALSTPRTVLFGGADGHLGSVFTHGSDGTAAIRFRYDGLVRFAPQVVPHIPILRASIGRHTITLPAQPGSGYVINNHRWLHGRRGYEGPRLIYRVTADPRRGTGIAPGFQPASEPLAFIERYP